MVDGEEDVEVARQPVPLLEELIERGMLPRAVALPHPLGALPPEAQLHLRVAGAADCGAGAANRRMRFRVSTHATERTEAEAALGRSSGATKHLSSKSFGVALATTSTSPRRWRAVRLRQAASTVADRPRGMRCCDRGQAERRPCSTLLERVDRVLGCARSGASGRRRTPMPQGPDDEDLTEIDESDRRTPPARAEATATSPRADEIRDEPDRDGCRARGRARRHDAGNGGRSSGRPPREGATRDTRLGRSGGEPRCATWLPGLPESRPQRLVPPAVSSTWSPWDGETLCFVEIKARNDQLDDGVPAQAVDRAASKPARQWFLMDWCSARGFCRLPAHSEPCSWAVSAIRRVSAHGLISMADHAPGRLHEAGIERRYRDAFSGGGSASRSEA